MQAPESYSYVQQYPDSYFHLCRKRKRNNDHPSVIKTAKRPRVAARERERLCASNNAFEVLKQLIPVRLPPGRKLGKKQTLEFAVKYISFLRECIDGKQNFEKRHRFMWITDPKEEDLLNVLDSVCTSSASDKEEAGKFLPDQYHASVQKIVTKNRDGVCDFLGGERLQSYAWYESPLNGPELETYSQHILTDSFGKAHQYSKGSRNIEESSDKSCERINNIMDEIAVENMVRQATGADDSHLPVLSASFVEESLPLVDESSIIISKEFSVLSPYDEYEDSAYGTDVTSSPC